MQLFKLSIYFLIFISSFPSWAEINSITGFYIGSDFAFARYNPPREASLEELISMAAYIRPLLGYRVNDYLAIEGRYNNLVNHSRNGGEITTGLLGEPSTYGPDHYKLYAMDLAGKMIYPFYNGVSIYGKAGLAYAHQDAFNQQFTDWIPSIDSKDSKALPLLGVGVSYNFTPHFFF